MALSLELGKKYLGKPVIDSYGRSMGRIVGLVADVKNEVSQVEIELGNGDFFNCPSYQVSFKEGEATYIYQWKIDADHIAKELDLAIRRLRALDDLFRIGEIPKDIYDDFKKQHEAAVSQLRERRQTLVNGLKDRIGRLNIQIKELQTFLASLKMQHTTGDLEDAVYKDASSSIEAGLSRTFSEKEDIQAVIDDLLALDRKPVEVKPPELKPPELKPPALTLEPKPSASSQPAAQKDAPFIVHVEDR
ncbi:MAG: CdvA-like protein [Candidatus Bathyarchaeia archaeon]